MAEPGSRICVTCGKVPSAEQVPLCCSCHGAHKAVLCLALLGRG